jgi:transcriptional regulator with GAF, ATPase, and Fis domain
MAKPLRNSEEIELPELEAAEYVPESVSSSMAGLFSEDAVAITATKLNALEAFLALSTKELSFHDFTREILMTVMSVVRCEAGSLLELDHSTNMLFFRAVAGRSSDRVSRFVVPMGKGIVGFVAESRQPILVNNVEENEVYLKSIQAAVGFEARNLVALPIVIKGRVYGVLELLNRVGESTFDQADLELLTYLTDHISKVLQVRLMIAWAKRSRKDDASESSESGTGGGKAA